MTTPLNVLRQFAISLLCSSCLSVYAASEADSAGIAPQSPRLTALATALDRHDQNALTTFWNDIDLHHEPLIEDLPNRPDDSLYTFLWRSDPAEDAVNIRLGATFPTRSGNDSFQRLGKSNVWYTSYILPKSARLVYRIRAPQGMQPSPLTHDRFTIDGIRYELFRDPLNAETFPTGSGKPDDQSLVIGPSARQNDFVEKRSDVARGTLATFEIDSKILNGKRTVTVYLPDGYANTSKPVPFLLMFDAEPYIDLVATPTILDNMIAKHAVPPLIAVFLHSKATRDDDLQPNREFQKFVASELMPWIRGRYRISSAPARNTVAGSSLGGLTAAYTAFTHAEIFGNVISQSGSYWWSPNYQSAPTPSPNMGWMIKQVAESSAKPIRFYMDAGTWEPVGMLSSNRILFSVLKGKGYEVAYTEFVGGHHYAYWQQTLPHALVAAFGDEARRH